MTVPWMLPCRGACAHKSLQEVPLGFATAMCKQLYLDPARAWLTIMMMVITVTLLAYPGPPMLTSGDGVIFIGTNICYTTIARQQMHSMAQFLDAALFCFPLATCWSH